jgi:catechol 2,3-dioxygenase-like lactoylglutathione lyase family enzyme
VRIKGLVWLGTRTERFEETVAFAEQVLGLPAPERGDGLAYFELEDGSAFEVFTPESPGGGHPGGLIAGFEVEDVGEACRELAAAGAEVSDLHEGEQWRWAYFRAPDGNVYELVGH